MFTAIKRWWKEQRDTRPMILRPFLPGAGQISPWVTRKPIEEEYADWLRNSVIQLLAARKFIMLVVRSADTHYFGNDLVDAIIQAHQEREVKVILIAHRQGFLEAMLEKKNEPFAGMVRAGVAELRLLDDAPRADFRVVDGCSLYICPYGPPEGQRPALFIREPLNVDPHCDKIYGEVAKLYKTSELATPNVCSLVLAR